jgi:putative ABC transport system ATP-binding protein
LSPKGTSFIVLTPQLAAATGPFLPRANPQGVIVARANLWYKGRYLPADRLENTMHAALLEARQLRRRLGVDHWLLHDLSLQLGSGDRLALRGPSGAGKTLLLRALAKLDRVDDGEICFRGQSVPAARTPQFRREVIYLHQRAALLEDRVEAALQRPFLLAAHRHRRYQPQRIVQWLERLGRDAAFLGKSGAELSGGEIQLTALLRALQLDPAVLLLDEPTAALDGATAAVVEQMLIEWVDDEPAGRALLWVTHDVQQAGRVGRRTLHIQQGRLSDD